MKLKKIIKDLPIEIYRGGDVEITGLCSHSKLVAPGNLFIAKRGSADDGGNYIDEALSAGASAILTDLPNPFLKKVVQLIHPDVKEIEPLLAARFYENPSKSLYTVGVTGTNGKTTVTYLLKHLFDGLNLLSGMIGTIEYMIGDHCFEAELTTPDCITNQRLLKEMVRQNCKVALLEASSHGLAQGRCAYIQFDAAIFTNLSQDHLDYHKTMEAYAGEKAKLFSTLSPDQYAIVNHESPWLQAILAHNQAHVISYGFSDKADLYATQIELSSEKTFFEVHYKDQRVQFSWNLIGRLNILNCLAALTLCVSKGMELESLVPLVATFQPPSGRLERVENLSGLNIFVDYAHTPDALEKVLDCLAEIKHPDGKIITVFGCGGERDRGKRAEMGKIAEKGSDSVLITSDNPRSENPEQICSEILKGCTSSSCEVIVDRAAAIEKAIEAAHSKDLILIAGKGHETYQLFAHQKIPFDDRKVAQKIANRVSV